MTDKEIIIEKDKIRMILLILPALIFVGLGLWIAFFAPELNTNLLNGQILKI